MVFLRSSNFPPAADHPITMAAPTPFWEIFSSALTHPAGWSSFYTLLLFVRLFASLVYGGQIAPPAPFFLWLPNPDNHLKLVLLTLCIPPVIPHFTCGSPWLLDFFETSVLRLGT
jgi:hypothetical protein